MNNYEIFRIFLGLIFLTNCNQIDNFQKEDFQLSGIPTETPRAGSSSEILRSTVLTLPYLANK